MKTLVAILSFAILGTGCASSTKQVDSLLARSHEYPPTKEIADVPFIKQEAGLCGPATLAMAFTWAGRKSTADEVAPLVYTPGAKGTFQTDMITAARREGFTAIPISGFDALLTEIDAGHPVIVFENLAVSWLPQWHYAIVYGYDLKQEIVVLHSGPHRAKHWDIRKFERSWKLGDYWGLVVLPSDQLAASAGELEHALAAAALEQIGRHEEATNAYQAILNKWPTSLSGLIGMGNWAFSAGNYVDAVGYLQIATKAHPSSSAAWHNLALAETEARMSISAQESARRAVETAPQESRNRYQESLRTLLEESALPQGQSALP